MFCSHVDWRRAHTFGFEIAKSKIYDVVSPIYPGAIKICMLQTSTTTLYDTALNVKIIASSPKN